MTSVDEALLYLQNHHEQAATDTSMLKTIRRKVDLKVFPFLALVHLIQNLDKYALNVSSANP